MPTLLKPVLHMQGKPHPISHDSGQEHSLDHWLEVHWLVEEDYLFARDADSEPRMIESRPLRQPAKSEHSARSADHHRRSAPHR